MTASFTARPPFIAMSLGDDDKPAWVSIKPRDASKALHRKPGKPWEYSWSANGEKPTEAEIAEAERLERLVLR